MLNSRSSIKVGANADVLEMPHPDIEISLPDGKKMEGKALETSPLDIAKKLSNSLAEKVMVA